MPDQPPPLSAAPAAPPVPAKPDPADSLDADTVGGASRRRLLIWTLILLNVTLVIFLLKWADAFFMPLVAGIFLSYTLGPIVDFLQLRLRLPRALGSAVAILAFMGVIGGIGYAVWWQAIDLAESMPESINRVTRSVRQVQVDRSSSLSKLNQAAQAVDNALKSASPAPRGSQSAAAQAAPAPERVSSLLMQRALRVVGGMGTLGSVLLLAYFLLTAGDSFRRKTVRVVSKRWQHKRVTVELLDDIHSSVQQYLGSLVMVNLLLGLLTYVTLLAQGFRNAEIWATLAGILHVIPYVGPLLTAIGVFIAGVQQWGAIVPAALAAGSTLVVAALVGSVAYAWILGRIANINHSAQFIALLFFGWLWGALGLLIAIPLVVVIKVIAARVDALHPVAEFLRE
ncbi:MAG: AI-2E family transporter [Brachymonas denitrificans]|uniref:AI-2E family transporter n=1 Tax=Brachymonas denitrificans TaxID=28220 RepID=UPI001BCD5867|nr:AI-2E family transporter [Brachymonas denitrificans]